MKANKISLSDFTFTFSGYGHYKVQYTSPVTQKKWSAVTNNIALIDLTKNEDNPKKTDLNDLKRICKNCD